MEEAARAQPLPHTTSSETRPFRTPCAGKPLPTAGLTGPRSRRPVPGVKERHPPASGLGAAASGAKRGVRGRTGAGAGDAPVGDGPAPSQGGARGGEDGSGGKEKDGGEGGSPQARKTEKQIGNEGRKAGGRGEPGTQEVTARALPPSASRGRRSGPQRPEQPAAAPARDGRPLLAAARCSGPGELRRGQRAGTADGDSERGERAEGAAFPAAADRSARLLPSPRPAPEGARRPRCCPGPGPWTSRRRRTAVRPVPAAASGRAGRLERSPGAAVWSLGRGRRRGVRGTGLRRGGGREGAGTRAGPARGPRRSAGRASDFGARRRAVREARAPTGRLPPLPGTRHGGPWGPRTAVARVLRPRPRASAVPPERAVPSGGGSGRHDSARPAGRALTVPPGATAPLAGVLGGGGGDGQVRRRDETRGRECGSSSPCRRRPRLWGQFSKGKPRREPGEGEGQTRGKGTRDAPGREPGERPPSVRERALQRALGRGPGRLWGPTGVETRDGTRPAAPPARDPLPSPAVARAAAGVVRESWRVPPRRIWRARTALDGSGPGPPT